MTKKFTFITIALTALVTLTNAVHATDFILAETANAKFTPSQILAQKRWKEFNLQHAKVCDARLDSIGVFTPGSKKVAIVLHGLGSNPATMVELIKTLSGEGYSVLAPRLTGHFNEEMTDLDQATYRQWVLDSEKVYGMARLLGSDITVVGYSLGGLLASRLAVKYYDYIARGVFFAPAWRISSLASLGVLAGSILHQSLNDFTHKPYSCNLRDGYIPSGAGQQVEDLIEFTEHELHGSLSYGNPTSSVFRRIYVPHLVFTTSGDFDIKGTPSQAAIDGDAVHEICHINQSCQEVAVPNSAHVGFAESLGREAGGHSMKSLMLKFLRKTAQP